MKLCWLIPDDKGGGVASVALSCCRQAAKAGHQTTLLTVISPTGWIGNNHDFRLSSLNLRGSAQDTPETLLQWLEKNPQDILFLNGCEQADVVIPYLPSHLKCVYVIHDTASRYWQAAIREQDNLDAIVAVSETVANQFKNRLKQNNKLYTILNGCVFPEKPNTNNLRQNDLIFMGGEKPIKGAFDVLKLWKNLIEFGFTGKLHWFGKVTGTFQDQINRLPNSKQIHIYGRVKRDLIFSTAASAKVVLMLSHVEPFGMATIEAMSMGCVPVAWDIETGTKEIVIANQTGLFAPLGNLTVLARQVLHACENYQAYGDVVIEEARTKFDESVMWKGYESLIDSIAILEPITRSKQGQKPTIYTPPTRRFQLLPSSIRFLIREFVGKNPRLGYLLRDMRGF